MAAFRARVGFVSANSRWGPHYDHFLALVPADVSVEIKPLGLWRESLDDLKGAADVHLEKTRQLIGENDWQGIAVMGAPVQVRNPGLIESIRQIAKVPVTSALGASSEAIRAVGARRVLLLTPFDPELNGLILEYLAGRGIEAILPGSGFRDVGEAVRLTAQDVYDMAVNATRAAGQVDAIYFQGAPLDPLMVLERLEHDLGVPVVASNPSMLWHVLSLIGLRYNLPNGGRLLREWPHPVTA